MKQYGFFKGMGMGLVVGTSLGMAVSPRRRSKNAVSKALRVAGDLAENLGDAIRH